jgi:hypothetical protein
MNKFLSGSEKPESIVPAQSQSKKKQPPALDDTGVEINTNVKYAILQAIQQNPTHGILSLFNETEHEKHANIVPTIKQKTKSKFGDYTCDIVLVLFGYYKKQNKTNEVPFNPKEVAESIANKIEHESIHHIECAPTGYINIFVHENHDAMAPKNKKQKLEQQVVQQQQKHKLTTTIVPSKFSQEEFDIYKKYQVAIHGDQPQDVTESGYKRFLCDTGLVDLPREKKPFQGYGSYHIQYRLDDKLIGVSVVDVLPHGLSSVYFFYLPEYSHLSLGVYSVLLEIDMIAKELSTEFTYYYLGYYIHRYV